MHKLTILDGGMGRELQDIGAPFSQPLWSAQALIEAPEFVSQAHQNFVDAGAEIVIVNSYACVPFHLGDALYQSDGARLATLAASIAHNVCIKATSSNRPISVAGAIPPPFGSYRPDLFDADKAKLIVASLVAAQQPYVDLWLAETISSIKEFEVIQTALSTTGKSCYYSFNLDDRVSNQACLRSGESVSSAAKRVCQTGAKAILFNCSIPEVMEQAIKDAKQVIEAQDGDVEIGVYANNFMPIKTDHEANSSLQPMRELSPDDYLVYAKRWYDAGASIIGGCCGIGPAHINALSQWKCALLDQ
ncbi:homocysteine S-methyltransferase family protein [Agarivorans sp. MS3-6]